MPLPRVQRVLRNGLVALSLTAALFVAGCQTPKVTPPAPEPKPAPTISEPAPLPPPPPVRLAEKAQVRAALLAPLSGTNAPLGHALVNAAELAVFELADARFRLVPLDTKGTPAGAQEAARKAIQEGADIILGPLLAAEVKAIAPITRPANIPVLAFTSDPSVLGNGVFSVGITPNTQIERMVKFAQSKGVSRFALLAPNDNYGRAVTRAFQGIVPATGASIAAVGSYNPGDKDYTASVKQFIESSKVGGQVGFDALLIPEVGRRLQTVVSLVLYYGVEPSRVRLLGNLAWSDPVLGSDPALHGSWFPAIAAVSHQEFESRYAAAFGALSPKISPLAALSYEATALAAVLARQPNGDYGMATLTSPDGFVGVDGIFRFRPDGTAERGLAVQEISGQGPVTLDPVPTHF